MSERRILDHMIVLSISGTQFISVSDGTNTLAQCTAYLEKPVLDLFSLATTSCLVSNSLAVIS